VRPSRKRPEYVERALKRDVLSVWRGRDARTIAEREVIELLDGIVERGSRVMANHVARMVGQMFKFGIHRAIVERSPVQLLVLPGGKEKPRVRVLSDAEIKAYLAGPTACTRYERLAHVVTLLLLTAQRRGELALARWADINFEARTWQIPDENAKTARGHIVPLSDSAVGEFQALRRLARHSPFVLPGNGGSRAVEPRLLTRGIAKNMKRFAKQRIARFTLHDLRRTAASGMTRLGIPRLHVEKVLNHSTGDIAEVYDRHDYASEKREALEKWAAHLMTLMSSTTRPT
jgi:integrase